MSWHCRALTFPILADPQDATRTCACFDKHIHASSHGLLITAMQIDGRHDNVEALCALVGASLFCSLLVQRSFTQQSELPSEIICWTVLPLLSKYTRWPVTRTVGISDLSDIRPIPFRSLWVIAAGVTVSSAYKSENGIIELLVSLRYGATRLVQHTDVQ